MSKFSIFVKNKNVLMHTSIKGFYENGKLTLLEPAPNTGRVEVLVTFIDSEKPSFPKKRVPGGLLELDHLKNKKMSIPDDFNEPLADLKEYM